MTLIDTVALNARLDSVLWLANREPGENPWGEAKETADFVDYWFAPTQRAQLRALTSAISAVEEPELKLALRLALSRIIVTKSPQASLAADTSHSRPHRVKTDSDYDVFSGLASSTKQLTRMLLARKIRGNAQVELGDARIMDGVADGSVDLAVTSPPYLNALDYLRGHKLALVWFGYRIGEIRTRRSESIGAESGLKSKVSEQVTEIVDVVETEATDKTKLKRPMIERFASDCLQFADQIHSKIRPGGTAVLVVGNSNLRGNYIRNDFIARTAMEHAGFSFVSSATRPIPSNKRYMAIDTKSPESSLARRMRDEVVLTMKK